MGGGYVVTTFRVSRRRREMYIGHARLSVCLSVCLSVAAFAPYCTDPEVSWGNDRSALLGGFVIGTPVSLL